METCAISGQPLPEGCRLLVIEAGVLRRAQSRIDMALSDTDPTNPLVQNAKLKVLGELENEAAGSIAQVREGCPGCPNLR